MVWYSHLLKNVPQFVVIHRVKGFGIVNKAEVDIFLKLSFFCDDPMDVGNLISGSSVFSKSSLNIWKFSVHTLLKPTVHVLLKASWYGPLIPDAEDMKSLSCWILYSSKKRQAVNKVLLIATGESIPLRGLEGVPSLPGAPQDEAGLRRKFETSHV